MSVTDMSALLVVAVRQNPAMFEETKHIVATSSWVQEKVMPAVVNRTMSSNPSWGIGRLPAGMRGTQGRLHNALWLKNPSRIRQLLDWGADPCAVTGLGGYTALIQAVLDPDIPLEIIRMLIDAAPGALTIPSSDGSLPLHYVMMPEWRCFCAEKVRLLLEAAPETAHLQNKDGDTPALLCHRFKAHLGEETLSLFKRYSS